MLKIAGVIPVKIYPFFWLLAIAIGWINTQSMLGTAIWTFIIFCSVLIHEYGHALTAMAFGQKATIDLMGFGGLTQRVGGKLAAWKEFVIVLNGPLAGFCLSGIAYLVLQKLLITDPKAELLLTQSVGAICYINLFWTAVNLVPIQPMDGGKLLNILLEGMFGLRGTKIALFISFLLAALLSVFFFVLQAFLAGALFLMFTYESYRSWKASLDLSEKDQNYVLQNLLKEAELDKQTGQQDLALAKFKHIREMTNEGVIYLTASERLAQILAEKEEYQAAYDILEALKNKLNPEAWRLLHQLAYRLKLWQETISLGDRTYYLYPNYDVALINALANSFLGQVRPAIGWLQCAIREGIPNIKHVLNQHEFDSIRRDPLFQDLTQNVE